MSVAYHTSPINYQQDFGDIKETFSELLHHDNEKISIKEIEVRNQKIKTLDNIKHSVLPVVMSIKNAKDVISEKEYLVLQDKLEKCHIKLDEVETNGDEEVRNKRKAIASMVSAVLKLLDTKAKKEYTDSEEPSNTNDLSDELSNKEFNTITKKEYTESEEPSNIKDDISDELSNEEFNTITEVHETDRENDSTTDKELDKTRYDLNNNRVKMAVFDHKVQLAIDVSDFEQDSMRVTLVNGEVVVIGKRENKRLQLRRNLPQNCLADSAQSKLSSDGVLFINIPRQRQIYHRRNLPFWF